MAQVIPMERSEPPLLKKPLTPMTAFSFRSASVVAGLSRSTLPRLSLRLEVSRERIDVDLQAGDGKSRLRADTGPTPPRAAPWIALCSWSLPPQ